MNRNHFSKKNICIHIAAVYIENNDNLLDIKNSPTVAMIPVSLIAWSNLKQVFSTLTDLKTSQKIIYIAMVNL